MRRYKPFFVQTKDKAIKLMRKARKSGSYATYHSLKKGKKYVVRIFN